MCQNQLRKPVAMAWLPLGLMFVLASMFMPHFSHPSGRFAQDWADALRGFALGIGIGIELVGLRLARQCGSSGS